MDPGSVHPAPGCGKLLYHIAPSGQKIHLFPCWTTGHNGPRAVTKASSQLTVCFPIVAGRLTSLIPPQVRGFCDWLTDYLMTLDNGCWTFQRTSYLVFSGTIGFRIVIVDNQPRLRCYPSVSFYPLIHTFYRGTDGRTLD